MNSNDLSLIFIAGNQVESQMIESYKEIFSHWQRVWSETFKEVEGSQTLFSDDFTRQDEIMALFYKTTCISICCHRLGNLALPSFKKDSYFKAWSDESIQALAKDGQSIIIDSQISVDPEHRKLEGGIRVIELMTCLSLQHLTQLKVSGITAAARNLRSMNQVFEKFNPVLLEKEVLLHGEETNLYAFYPSQDLFQNSASELLRIGDRLLQFSIRSQFINPFFSSGTRIGRIKISA